MLDIGLTCIKQLNQNTPQGQSLYLIIHVDVLNGGNEAVRRSHVSVGICFTERRLVWQIFSFQLFRTF